MHILYRYSWQDRLTLTSSIRLTKMPLTQLKGAIIVVVFINISCHLHDTRPLSQRSSSWRLKSQGLLVSFICPAILPHSQLSFSFITDLTQTLWLWVGIALSKPINQIKSLITWRMSGVKSKINNYKSNKIDTDLSPDPSSVRTIAE